MVLALISAIPIAIRFMVQPFLCLPVLPWQGLIENTAHRPSFHPARYLRSPGKGSPRVVLTTSRMVELVVTLAADERSRIRLPVATCRAVPSSAALARDQQGANAIG
jgi:hypothetical protein